MENPKKKHRFRIRGNPLFKRHLIPQKNRKTMLKILQKKLNEKFFDSLPKLQDYNPQIRVCKYNGKRVIIKDTKGNQDEGFNFQELRNSFLEHQKSARQKAINTDSYILRSPKIYGRIGNYLVMELIEDKYEEIYSSRPELRNKMVMAFNQLRRNFRKLKSDKLIKRIPQLYPMITGIENSRWVFYLSYDYL